MRTEFRQVGRGGARNLAALALALLTAACATDGLKPTHQVTPPAFVASPGLTPAQRVEAAIQDLRQGRAEQARAELTATLAVDPANQRAHRLLTQLDTDPKLLLGEKNYPYKVRPGETLWGLSQRLLGDPLMFYALARYNQIDTPAAVTSGQMLRMPGVAPKKPALSRRTATKAVPNAGPAGSTPAPAAQAKASNPAGASQLRRSALEHMSRGQIDQAETLLQQARDLDPGNPVIQGDLDRARRIQASVRPRS